MSSLARLCTTLIHAVGEAENLGAEFLELVNTGSTTIDLTDWSISRGVTFVFPDLRLDPGAHLTVAADIAVFRALYPQVTAVAGPWQGHLSNSSEAVELTDAAGRLVDRVDYADQGDWSERELGPESFGHRGWRWRDDHDGGGKSLELIHLRLSNAHGQNWAASVSDGGTPGRVNSSRIAERLAPIIRDVAHWPPIPSPVDKVEVQARVVNDGEGPLTLRLHYRADPQGSFQVIPMIDDGRAGDHVYGATIPAQGDKGSSSSTSKPWTARHSAVPGRLRCG